ncbi:MAG: haloacid dehalogenase-like hydrolase [Thermomicrobiales bacterium]
MPRLPLILFDVDGTLLGSGDQTHGMAVTVACQDLFNVPGDRRLVDLAGRTDRYILLNLLQAHGLTLEEVEPRIPEAIAYMCDYVAREIPASLAERVLPGVSALLDALTARDLALGLVTGNPLPIARSKLQSAGIWAPFARHDTVIGGFGDHSHERNDLPPLALDVAARILGAPVSAADTIIIGDTPHDIACARACASARTIAVATGRRSADQLHANDPDLLLPDLTDRDTILNFLLAALTPPHGAGRPVSRPPGNPRHPPSLALATRLNQTLKTLSLPGEGRRRSGGRVNTPVQRAAPPSLLLQAKYPPLPDSGRGVPPAGMAG